MDKNFVHIDELFKRGLEVGEEQEQSGAWLRMQELLDKEMPVGTAPTKGSRLFKRRYLGLLLLLISIGGGAYIWQQREPVQVPAVATLSSDANTIKQVKHISQPATLDELTKNTTLGSRNSVEKLTTPTNKTQATKQNTPTSKVASAAISNSTTTAVVAPIGAKNNKQTSEQNLPQSKVQNSSTVVNTTSNKNTAILKSGLATNSKSKAIQEAEESLIDAAKNKGIVQGISGNFYKTTDDSATQITELEHTTFASTKDKNGTTKHYPVTKREKIEEKRIPIKRIVPLSAIESLAIAGLNVDVATVAEPLNPGILYASGEKSVRLVTLSKFEVSQKYIGAKSSSKSFSETKNALLNMFDGTKPFYISLLAGANYAVANPSVFGIQMGVAAFYTLSQRLTLGAELRYANNFMNYTYTDQYTTYGNVNTHQNGSVFEHVFDKNAHSDAYLAKNMGSLQLPIYLNYSFGRFSIFGGVQLANSFALHSVMQNKVATTQEEISSSVATLNLIDEKSTLNKTDFGSKLGLGYVAGVQYDINRKLSLDFRATQIVTDNATTKAAKEISKNTFKLPTLNLGIQWNFGKREKVMYIMNGRKK